MKGRVHHKQFLLLLKVAAITAVVHILVLVKESFIVSLVTVRAKRRIVPVWVALEVGATELIELRKPVIFFEVIVLRMVHVGWVHQKFLV